MTILLKNATQLMTVIERCESNKYLLHIVTRWGFRYSACLTTRELFFVVIFFYTAVGMIAGSLAGYVCFKIKTYIDETKRLRRLYNLRKYLFKKVLAIRGGTNEFIQSHLIEKMMKFFQNKILGYLNDHIMVDLLTCFKPGQLYKLAVGDPVVKKTLVKLLSIGAYKMFSLTGSGFIDLEVFLANYSLNFIESQQEAIINILQPINRIPFLGWIVAQLTTASVQGNLSDFTLRKYVLLFLFGGGHLALSSYLGFSLTYNGFRGFIRFYPLILGRALTIEMVILLLGLLVEVLPSAVILRLFNYNLNYCSNFIPVDIDTLAKRPYIVNDRSNLPQNDIMETYIGDRNRFKQPDTETPPVEQRLPGIGENGFARTRYDENKVQEMNQRYEARRNHANNRKASIDQFKPKNLPSTAGNVNNDNDYQLEDLWFE